MRLADCVNPEEHHRRGIAVSEPPLCVDMDGTLVRSDTFWEMLLCLVRTGFWWLVVPFWLWRGRAYVKRSVALHAPLDVSLLPFNQELLQELTRQHLAGRRIVLCTGADENIALKVAVHLRLFDTVLSSNAVVNLTGQRKRQLLEREYGRRAFDYIGDSPTDFTVWQAARKAFVVNPSHGLLQSLENTGVEVAGTFSARPLKTRPALWLHAIRLHQWTKNLLLLVPLILAHNFGVMAQGLGAFLAFGFAASSGYLLNDLFDLQADRQHTHKRRRPFASGDLSLTSGLAAVPLLWLLCLIVCLGLPAEFAIFLLLYLIGTQAYSLWLKRYTPIDVILLAGLYTIRIIAGGAATHIAISPWTLAVSIFLFLSLAMIKRVSELRGLAEADTLSVPGRNYSRVDIQQLSSLGAAAGYIAVVVMALYINSVDVQKLYKRPQWLWLLLPIFLYWISRMWLLVSRGLIDQDPLLFALKDRTTYIAGCIGLVIVLGAAL